MRVVAGIVIGVLLALPATGSAGDRYATNVLATPPARPLSAPGRRASDPFYKTWWFWTAVGVMVGGTVGTVFVLRGSDSAYKGDLGPGKIQVK